MQPKHTLPAFDHAIDSFERFLAEQGHSGNVFWIFREDITWHRGKLFVKLPLPSENQSLVAQLYERGCVQRLGLLMDMFCLVASQPCCYIWLPQNEQDAHLAQLAGLKFSAHSNPPIAQPVRNRLLWLIHGWLGKRAGAEKWLFQLPKRSWMQQVQ
jgi:hypothetical protein